MLINLRNALMAGRRLPYDAEVEYLESSGTQYIDTGIVSTGFGIRADVVCAQTQSGGEMAIVGRSRGDGFELYSNYNAGKFGLWNRSGNYIELTRQLELSRVYSISAEITTTPTMTLSIDGNVTTRSITSATIADGNILVFKHTSYYFKGRIYSCKIWQNGVLVRDYIPVRKGTVGYLYDRVSGRLFGNAGTGDFVCGPDVVPMTWQDGLQYNNVGTPVESATSSIGLDYIPITAGHSFTWRLGYGSSASADLIIYNANKERIDYWVARDRTVTISGEAAYMRISALTSYKEQATVYDETAQKYVFANGRIPAE